MKRLSPFFFVLGILLSSKSYAATFNVTTSSGGGGVPNCAADTNDPKINCNLQEALTVSEANGADDTINLAAGSGGNYTTPPGSPFQFSSGETSSLTITGAGIGATILDGGGTNEVMTLLNSTAGNIQVSGVTFQNGVFTTSIFASGLGIQTIGGNATVDTCEIKGNSHTEIGGLFLFTLSPGNTSLLNSRVTGNTASDSGSFGGAVVVSGIGSSPGTVNVDNNIFSNNSGDETGGGAFGALGTVTVSNNTFDTNTGTTGQGAAFISSGEANIIANNNTVINNTGDEVGGLLLLVLGTGPNNSIQLTNSTFNNNTGPNGMGGASVASPGSVLIDHNTFFQNTGEIGGGTFSSVMSDITFTNNTFDDNTATGTMSGAVVGAGGPITAENNTVFSNQGLQGASAFFSNAEISFINNIIASNTSTDTNTVDGGGATLFSPSSMAIINNTIVDNTLNNNSGFGGGLKVTMSSDASNTNIYNNIIFGNSVLTAGNGQDLFIDNSPGLNASINFFNNDYDEICFTNGGTQTCNLADVANLSQGANLTAPGLDPLFIDPVAGNFQLGVGSPAIDTGDSSAPSLPATDHDGNPRIVGAEVDMGALEAQPDIGVTPTDLDFNGVGIGQSDTQIITISNAGSVPMIVNGMVLSDDVNYSLDPNAGPNPCGSLSFTLDVNESCTVGVIFTPTTNGSFDATLTISSDDPDEPEIVVTITGIGEGFELSGGGCACSLESAAPPINYLALGLIPLVLGILRFRMKQEG